MSENLTDISKFDIDVDTILNSKDKNTVLSLIKNNKIPKSNSLKLFQFIMNNDFLDMIFDLDYSHFDINVNYDYIFK